MPFQLPRSIAPGRCIVFIICVSLIVMLSTPSSKLDVEPPTYHDVQFIPRQDIITPPIPSPTPSSPTTSPTTSTTSTQTSTTSEQSSPTTSPTTTTTSTTSDQLAPTPPPSTPSGQIKTIESTGSDGSPVTVVVTVGPSGPTSTPTPTPKDDGGDESSGLGTGSIIGLSVAGGIALLGVIAFFIWKFTRKRRAANYDDGEIKWPDLNSESHIAGHDDHPVPQSISDGASIRDHSFRGAYSEGGLGASQSQVDLYAADPYAVPPLPHLNPNQPYRDDPGVPYHDNFSVPAFHESRPNSPSIRGEAIPMNQINRSRSPGPQGALNMGYGGRQSPGPQDAYGGGIGRQSPGPQDAYGGGYGRRSPGPNDAYGLR